MSQQSHDKLDPYAWQLKALEAWEAAKRRGIVEAVTGSGKTYLAIYALAKLYGENPRLSTLIVVPTIPLMNQWHDRLLTAFPSARVGRIGGGFDDDYTQFPIACVAVINSALKKVGDLLDHCRYPGNRSLLVADECHHYIHAPVFSRIRAFPFDYTLGITATIEDFEVDGLGKIVYTYRFTDAHRDGVVPPFDLVNVPTPLNQVELDRYLELTDRIREQLRLIRDLYDTQLDSVPDHFFFHRLKQLMSLPDGNEDPVIQRFFVLLFKRAKIYYMAERKMVLAAEMTRMLVEQGHKKVVVFFERIHSAEAVSEDVAREAATRLRDALRQEDPIWCKLYHSVLSNDERKRTLTEFRDIGPSALLACKSLDEGIDIPEVDAAILVASTQSVRQRIQRIGRTLRKGSGKKRPLIVTLFCPGTNDSNVTTDDRELFRGVARVFDEDSNRGMARVRELLSSPGLRKC